MSQLFCKPIFKPFETGVAAIRRFKAIADQTVYYRSRIRTAFTEASAWYINVTRISITFPPSVNHCQLKQSFMHCSARRMLQEADVPTLGRESSSVMHCAVAAVQCPNGRQLGDSLQRPVENNTRTYNSKAPYCCSLTYTLTFQLLHKI